MQHCPSCKSKIVAGALFCDVCGETLSQVQVARKLRQTSFDNIKDAKEGLLSPGERIKSKHTYLIEEAIARSGFGATFRATRLSDKKTVLIKQMLDQTAYDQFKDQLLKSFKREAKFLRKIKHPAFPRGYEYFERNRSFYLVMDFINGKELSKAIDEYKAANGKVLLGTLEGMSAGTKSFSWEVPKDFLTGGVAKKQFKIAATTKPIQLGFYLCTAKGGDKTCQNKKVRDINEIFTEHLTKKPKAGEEERVIFYQYFLVDDRGLTAFQGYPKGEQQFDELKKYAGVRKFQGEKINEGIDKAKAALTTLVSLPVVFNKDSLTIELPKYDVAACAKIQKEN